MNTNILCIFFMGADIFVLIYKISIPTNFYEKKRKYRTGKVLKHSMTASIINPKNNLKVNKKIKIFLFQAFYFCMLHFITKSGTKLVHNLISEIAKAKFNANCTHGITTIISSNKHSIENIKCRDMKILKF